MSRCERLDHIIGIGANPVARGGTRSGSLSPWLARNIDPRVGTKYRPSYRLLQWSPEHTLPN